MKNSNIRQTTKSLLVFFGVLVLSCSQFQKQKIDSADEVLNNLSKRFSQNDYASYATNPHANFGKEVGNIYRKILQNSTHPIYHGSRFVQINPENQRRLKGMTKAAVEEQGIGYSEEYIDRFSAIMKDYTLTSEDMTRFLSDAVKNQTITKGEHDIIFLELQEMAGSTSNFKLRAIIRTVESEITNSGMSPSSKDKILLINAFAMNSLVDDLRPMANRSVPTLLSGPFQKTTPVVVGTIFVMWAIGTLISAWTDPTCDLLCQTNMAINASTYVGLGELICSVAGANSPCPCYPPCFLRGPGCVCP